MWSQGLIKILEQNEGLENDTHPGIAVERKRAGGHRKERGEKKEGGWEEKRTENEKGEREKEREKRKRGKER